MTEEERQRLSHHLAATQWEWMQDNGQGCETCGYGGGIEVDWARLLKEIEEFSKTFQK